MSMRPEAELVTRTAGTLDVLAKTRMETRANAQPGLVVSEIGVVRQVGHGVVRVTGLPGCRLEEILEFERGGFGLAFNLEPGDVGAVVLAGDDIRSGDEVRRTGRVLDVPVGDGLLGRVIDPLGQPLDAGGEVNAIDRWPVERPSAPIMHRDPVEVPLQTGIKVIDALIPIGRGQRQLILGDRQTGKTAVAVDAIINQIATGVVAVYCSIGQSSVAVARLAAALAERGALAHTVVIAAVGDSPAGMQYVAPYAATSVAEYFMEHGRDAVVVYDDLTRHARSYREISLLLRRPPGREAFPGDIFYIHSRLLERATRLRAAYGGGSLTALPIVETEAQNLSAYIPTNVISITDGQIYLSPDLFRLGVLPAVDVGKSVSRVGGRAQLPAYSKVAGALRLAYSQFAELESFARFGTRLDPETRNRLERGYRVREVLKQRQYAPAGVVEQIAALLAVNEGLFDPVALDDIRRAEVVVGRAVREQLPELAVSVASGEPLSDEQRVTMVAVMTTAIKDADLGAVTEKGPAGG